MAPYKANTKKAKSTAAFGEAGKETSKLPAWSTPNTRPYTWETKSAVLTRNVPGAKDSLVKCENQILAEVCQLRARFGDKIQLMASELACQLELELSNEAIYKGVVLSCGFPAGYPSKIKMPVMRLLDKAGKLDVQSFDLMQQSLASTLTEVFGISGVAKETPVLQVVHRLSSILHCMPMSMHSQVQSCTVYPTMLGFPVMPVLVPCMMSLPTFNHTMDLKELEQQKQCTPAHEDQLLPRSTSEEAPTEMPPTQHTKQNSPVSSHDMSFVVNLEKVKMGYDTRTSVMLRGIPRADTEETIMDFLAECGLTGKYTFFYMPSDRQKRTQHAGMAFVDFKSPEDILTLCSGIRSHRKKLSVVYSRVQGHRLHGATR